MPSQEETYVRNLEPENPKYAEARREIEEKLRQLEAKETTVKASLKYTSDAELIHRFTYHAPGPIARQEHDWVRGEFRDLAVRLNARLPEGRDKSLTFTALEEASYRAHAAIARDPVGVS